MKIFEYIYGTFCALCVIIGLGYALSNGNSNKSHSDPNTFHSSKPYNRYQNQQKIDHDQLRKTYEEIFKEQPKPIQIQHIRVSNSPAHGGHTGTPRDNYRDLWNECEDIISALDDAGVDHEDLSYPMDYYDLRDLRDELESTAEEYDVNW